MEKIVCHLSSLFPLLLPLLFLFFLFLFSLFSSYVSLFFWFSPLLYPLSSPLLSSFVSPLLFLFSPLCLLPPLLSVFDLKWSSLCVATLDYDWYFENKNGYECHYDYDYEYD